MSATQQADALIGLAVGVTVLVGAVVTWWRWLRPKYRSLKAKGSAALDSLVGRDAILDSITGREISPALPGIEQRMDTVEQTLIKLADQRAHIEDHEQRITSLETAALERLVTRAESWQHLNSIDEALMADPAGQEES